MENELDEPVYDATGLTQHYNIIFTKDNIEPFESINNSLKALGLQLLRGQKEIEVLILKAK